jgi:hypothetical protein
MESPRIFRRRILLSFKEVMGSRSGDPAGREPRGKGVEGVGGRCEAHASSMIFPVQLNLNRSFVTIPSRNFIHLMQIGPSSVMEIPNHETTKS